MGVRRGGVMERRGNGKVGKERWGKERWGEERWGNGEEG